MRRPALYEETLTRSMQEACVCICVCVCVCVCLFVHDGDLPHVSLASRRVRQCGGALVMR